MTSGDIRESWVVHVRERRVIGRLRYPRIYTMANGDELTVVWCGSDRILLPDYPTHRIEFDGGRGGVSRKHEEKFSTSGRKVA